MKRLLDWFSPRFMKLYAASSLTGTVVLATVCFMIPGAIFKALGVLGILGITGLLYTIIDQLV